jgi:hypothetical protein
VSLIDELRIKGRQDELSDTRIPDFIAHLSTRTKHFRDSLRGPSEFLIDKMSEQLTDTQILKALILKNPKIMKGEFLEEVSKGCRLNDFQKETLQKLMPFLIDLFLTDQKTEIQIVFQYIIAKLKKEFPRIVKESHIRGSRKH